MESSRHIRGIMRVWLLLTLIVSMFTPTWLTPHPSAESHPLVRKLDTVETDMAAHAVGSEWHNPNDTPMVVNLGQTSPDMPVAGMDQWLSARGQSIEPRANVVGTKKYLVMRVYAQDQAATSYYAKDLADEGVTGLTRSVEEDIMKPLKQLFTDTTYGKVTLAWDITDLYQLPKSRSYYINDCKSVDASGTVIGESGDMSLACGDGLSETNKTQRIYSDAVSAIPSGYDFTDYVGIVVIFNETNLTRMYRGVGGRCNTDTTALPGVGRNTVYGCVNITENPVEGDGVTFGRLGHEMAHALQQGDVRHPSFYANRYELLDASYPGQIGAFAKQDDQDFPGWLPDAQYIDISAGKTTDRTCLRVLERVPDARPQVIRVQITGSRYYLISARHRILGDELSWNAAGIPDEGILVERVNESPGKDAAGNQLPWVTVIPKSGTWNLFKKGDNNILIGDNVYLTVQSNAQSGISDGEIYCVRVTFGPAVNEPDVAIRPWREAPGNTYETTDIWVDSPFNGYDVYRNGMWNDLSGVPVPRGNGDAPGVDAVNRLYARVRNVGTIDATDITVRFKVSTPIGVGVNNDTNWVEVGTVDKTTFPALASLPAGGYTDVYIEWTPSVELTDEQIEAGIFEYHTCVRVTIDDVAGEVTTGNQDGDQEQENIREFEATPVRSNIYRHDFNLHNNDMTAPKTYTLNLEGNLPPTWEVTLNDGDPSITVPANSSVTIPITVTANSSAVIGTKFSLQVNASSVRMLLTDNIDANGDGVVDSGRIPADEGDAARFEGENVHRDENVQGGFDFDIRVLAPTEIACRPYGRGARVEVQGELNGFEGIHQAGTPLRAYAQIFDSAKNPIPLDDRSVSDIGSNGAFQMNFSALTQDKTATLPAFVRCIFPGTHLLASSTTGFVPIDTTNFAPTLTPEPWGGSQFHFGLSLNSFLPPTHIYYDRVSLTSATTNQFKCSVGRCPLLVDGQHGRGVQFNSADDSYLQSNAAVTLNNTFAVSLWARRSKVDGASTMLSHGLSAVPNQHFNMGFDDNNHFTCGIYGDEIISRDPINNTDWHHYVCVVSGRSRKLYVDNVEVISKNSASVTTYNITSKVNIARRVDQVNSFNGAIDEVNIFTLVPTVATIHALYTAPGATYTGQIPISHLTFNEMQINSGTSRISCEGAACPVVTYPNTDYSVRPLERIGAVQLQKSRALTISSTAGVVAGSDSTLMFWARFGNLNDIGNLVNQTQVNRANVTVSAANRLSFANLNYNYNSTLYPFNRWHHYAFVKKGNALAIYINGNNVASGIASATLLPFRVYSAASMHVGGISAGNGELSSVELYNTALTDTDIVTRFAKNIDAAYRSPTLSSTRTQSPTKLRLSPTRTATINLLPQTKTSIVGRTATASRAAAATETQKAAHLTQTAVRWGGYQLTETAFIQTATALSVSSPTKIVIRIPSKTAVATLTPARSNTPTQSHTPSATRPSATATNTLSPTKTFTKSPTKVIIRPTATNTPKLIITRTRTSTPIK